MGSFPEQRLVIEPSYLTEYFLSVFEKVVNVLTWPSPQSVVIRLFVSLLLWLIRVNELCLIHFV